MSSTTSSFQGRAGTIRYRTWCADAPRFLVLLVHGYGEHAGRYSHVAERLVEAGAMVLAPDHHGHGASDGERALFDDLELLVDDLATLDRIAREAHPKLPVVLIGHSLGGLIATRYAQRGVELAALVLSGPFVGGNPAIRGLLALPELPEVTLDLALLSRDPKVGEAYAADELVYHGTFQRPTLEALFAAVDRVAEGPSLGGVPTLWLHGDQDGLAPLGPTRAAFERLRGSQLEERIYEGARHEVFNETNRDEVLSDLVSFLRRTVPAASGRPPAA